MSLINEEAYISIDALLLSILFPGNAQTTGEPSTLPSQTKSCIFGDCARTSASFVLRLKALLILFVFLG